MLTLRRTLRRFLAAFVVVVSGPAWAQFGATIAVDSDYRFRGVSLSDSKPAWRLTLNDDFSSGAYVGASATRVELAHDDPYTQLVGYAGWVSPVRDGHSLEFGVTASHFTGDSSYDYAEAYAGLLGSRWSLRLHYAPDYFGRRMQTMYVDASAHHMLDEHWRVFAHAGALVPIAGRVIGDNGRATRFDLRLGTGVALREFDLQLAWVAANAGGPYPAVYAGKRSAWVASAQWSF